MRIHSLAFAAAISLIGAATSQIQIALEEEQLSATSLGVLPGDYAPNDLYAVDTGGAIFVRAVGAADFSTFAAPFPGNHYAFAPADPYGFGEDSVLMACDATGPVPGWVLCWAYRSSSTTFDQAASLTVFVDETPRFLAALDVNLDGLQDSVVATTDGAGGGRLVVIRTDTALPIFTQGPSVRLSGEPTGMVSGDLDDDGDLDIALTLNTGELVIFANTGTGSLAPTYTVPVGSTVTGETPLGVTAGDLDDDGVVDLVVANGGGTQPDHAIQILSFSASSWSIVDTIAGGPVEPTGPVTMGRLDTDPDVDIAAATASGGQDQVSIFFNNQNDPNGPFATASRQDLAGGAVRNVTTTDRSGHTSLINMLATGVVQHHVHTPPEFLRGDANEDGGVDVADVVFILNALFVGGSPVPGNLDTMDGNDDGVIDISDAIYLNAWLFSVGSPPPPAPFPGPGVDPTEDRNPRSPNYDLNG